MYFFLVSLYKAKVGDEWHFAPVGCASLRLRGSGGNTLAEEYMPIALTRGANKGWYSSLFYVKNYADAPLPNYTSRYLTEKAPEWGHSLE